SSVSTLFPYTTLFRSLVLLEVEFGVSLPEEAVMNHDFDTVRNMTKLLFDAQQGRKDYLDYEEDIKLHCFVSCLSEVLKRRGIDRSEEHTSELQSRENL